MSETGHTINLQNAQRIEQALEDLLNLLYPPPLNPDIITLRDVLTRYRLTGLGVPAITALQQAQRILRAGKDYSQIGLCEFHIGLIYLHWGHCLASAHQFAEARRQWSFADETAAVCLSYFAQGQAQHVALHYEPAMGCYHKTDQWLPRLKLTPPSAQIDSFLPQITTLLREAQEILREKMWPPDEPEIGIELVTHEPITAVPSTPYPQTAESPSPESENRVHPPINPSFITVPPPRSNIIQEPRTPQIPSEDFASQVDVPIPLISHQAIEPASVLLTTKENLSWYRVVDCEDNTLPFIHKGTWLLVDSQARELYEERDVILVGGDHEAVPGHIQVEPYIAPPAYKRICLRQMPMIRQFTRDQAGRIKFEPVPMTFVLGVVLGFWLNPFQANLDAD